MKRMIFAMLALVLLLSGCGAEKTAAPAGGVDVDLTRLSSTMVYSEVYNMMMEPESYAGKSVRMRGQFATYHDPNTGTDYFACIISDATACCSQGLEFELEGCRYPEDYPPLGSDITVTGNAAVYMENGMPYCRLDNARLEE